MTGEQFVNVVEAIGDVVVDVGAVPREHLQDFPLGGRLDRKEIVSKLAEALDKPEVLTVFCQRLNRLWEAYRTLTRDEVILTERRKS